MTSSALLHLIKVCVHLHSIYYFSSSSDPFSFYFTNPFSSEGFSEIIKLEDMYEEEKYHYCLSTGEAWWKKQPEKNGEIPVLFAIWKNKEAAPAPGIISSSVNHKYSKQSPSTGICTWPRTVRHLPERLNTRDLSQYTHTYKDNIMLLHYCITQTHMQLSYTFLVQQRSVCHLVQLIVITKHFQWFYTGLQVYLMHCPMYCSPKKLRISPPLMIFVSCHLPFLQSSTFSACVVIWCEWQCVVRYWHPIVRYLDVWCSKWQIQLHMCNNKISVYKYCYIYLQTLCTKSRGVDVFTKQKHVQ